MGEFDGSLTLQLEEKGLHASSIESVFLSSLFFHSRTTPDPEDPNSGQEPGKGI